MIARIVALIFALAPAVAGAEPILIAHRGASAQRPEHTLAAYALAIDEGADFIEPDLVSTRDGVLVARHENEISTTTDVADHPEFAARRTTKMIDGISVTGWFTEDFTLAELKQLRARERLPKIRPANAAFDGAESIPTFTEILELLKRRNAADGRHVGVYPETKHPSYFRAIGLPLEDALLSELGRFGYRSADDPVFIQSFEVDNLRALRGRTKLRLIQLMAAEGGPADRKSISYGEMAKPAGLARIARYADGIGVEKTMLIPRDQQGWQQPPTALVRDAHAAGLLVHVWTFRPENIFLPANFRSKGVDGARGDAVGEIREFLNTGIDGFFTDSVPDGVKAR